MIIYIKRKGYFHIKTNVDLPAFFQVNALVLLPERCLILFYITYVILPLSLRCINFICEVYDFKYLNAV